MGRPPLEKKQRQLPVALPPEIRSRLEAAAAAGDRSLAEEIRRRIDMTIAWEATDPVTREFGEFVTRIAAQIRTDYFNHEWHALPQSHRAFVTAIVDRLAEYAPPLSVGVSSLWGPEDSPETIGRLRERDDRRAHSNPQLVAAQKRRAEDRPYRLTSRLVKGKDEKDD